MEIERNAFYMSLEPPGVPAPNNCACDEPSLSPVAPNNPRTREEQLRQVAEVDEGLHALAARAILPMAMVTGGAVVAVAAVTGAAMVCSTGVGCIVAAPVLGLAALGGAAMAAEGVYYGVTGEFWVPDSMKKCRK